MSQLILDERLDLPGPDEIARLEELVQSRLNGRLRSFQLAIRDHGLVLRGRAATYHTKQLAQHAIMGATQVPILANNVEVY